MNDMKHVIFNIQRFSVNDGPGIRTTVFMKGCMLNCLWCHNPESKSPRPQVFLSPRLCIGCGECIKACEKGFHSFSEDGKHLIDRAHCVLCGKCAEACVGALEMCGKEMTTEEIVKEVLKDKPFYENSGGGMTVSGGDPLFAPDFTLALLKEAKNQGLHTCIETSGFSRWEKIEALIPYVDLFLWDVKETDSEKHMEYTGVNNELILENLHKLDAAGAKTILRCPVIPGYNDRAEHFAGIGALAESLKNVQEINIEPYHPLGQSKSEAIGEEYALAGLTFPKEDVVKEWMAAIQRGTKAAVKKA